MEAEMDRGDPGGLVEEMKLTRRWFGSLKRMLTPVPTHTEPFTVDELVEIMDDVALPQFRAGANPGPVRHG